MKYYYVNITVEIAIIFTKIYLAFQYFLRFCDYKIAIIVFQRKNQSSIVRIPIHERRR